MTGGKITLWISLLLVSLVSLASALVNPVDNLNISTSNNLTVLNGGTFQLNDTANNGIIIIHSTSNVTLKGNMTTTPTVIVMNGSGLGVTIDRQNTITTANVTGVTVEKARYGLKTFRTNGLTLYGNQVKNTTFSTGIGIYVSRSNIGPSVVSNNNVSSMDVKTVRIDGIYIEQSDNVLVTGNNVSVYGDNGYAIDVIPASQVTSFNISIERNWIYIDGSTNGIVFGFPVKNSNITYNNITGRVNQTGIAIQYSDDNLINGNRINNTLNTGNTGDCINFAFNNTNNIVRDNVLINCDRSGIRPSSDTNGTNYYYNNTFISTQRLDWLIVSGNVQASNNTYDSGVARYNFTSTSNYVNLTVNETSTISHFIDSLDGWSINLTYNGRKDFNIHRDQLTRLTFESPIDVFIDGEYQETVTSYTVSDLTNTGDYQFYDADEQAIITALACEEATVNGITGLRNFGASFPVIAVILGAIIIIGIVSQAGNGEIGDAQLGLVFFAGVTILVVSIILSYGISILSQSGCV